MDTRTRQLTFAAMLVLLVIGASACTIATHRGVVVAPGHVVMVSAPERVYHDGSWLYYRGDGYYYYDDGAWIVAHSVPSTVGHYHHPVLYSTPFHRHYRHYTRHHQGHYHH
jgi:hypothetical protein